MGKRTKEFSLKGQSPEPPVGIVTFLRHWQRSAEHAANAFPPPTNAETAAYIVNQRRYWLNVASGIKWIIGKSKHMRARQRKQRK
jgi:hypothetical protein